MSSIQEEKIQAAAREMIDTPREVTEAIRAQEIQEQAAEIRTKERPQGRYSINDAIILLLAATRNYYPLHEAVKSGDIPCYEDETGDKKGDQNDQRSYVCWDDLNEWIEKQKNKLEFRFPRPSAPTPSGNADTKAVDASDAETASSTCKVFRDMPNLTASELSIVFVAGDSGTTMLAVSARNITKRVALAELDLLDRRKAEMNEQCGMLLAMAQRNFARTSDPKIARRISRLRAALKSALGIVDDPIAKFRNGVGYEPHFKVTDKRDTADIRAKREAERNTVSLDELSEQGIQVSSAAHGDYPFEDEEDDAAKLIRSSDKG
jgi:hypothetical protein